MSSSKTRSVGFTLIELLVVITIISILASLLMPSLRSARESAKGAVCVSNMKQISVAVATYTAEYQYYPFALTTPGANAWAGPNAFWANFLLPYVSSNSGSAILRCPSYSPRLVTPAPLAFVDGCPCAPFSATSILFTYGYNNSFGNHQGPTPGILADNVRNPSQKVMLCDGLRRAGGGPYGDIWYQSSVGYVNAPNSPFLNRHNGRNNILFCDSHVETWTPRQISNIWWQIP